MSGKSFSLRIADVLGCKQRFASSGFIGSGLWGFEGHARITLGAFPVMIRVMSTQCVPYVLGSLLVVAQVLAGEM